MDKHGAARSHDAIPVRDVDAPYAGQPGETRFESVHLVESDGSVRTHGVCRAINTRTHPELKLRALTGLLHRLDDGRELALPFVYHDPDARKFALVLPAALAHTELKEWSKLMAEIADDTTHTIPLYVRENTTVIGLLAFERYVMESDPEPQAEEVVTSDESLDTAQQASLLLQRERELAEQERALIRMAEGLTAREGELHRREEQLDTARIDIEIREAELADRRSAAGRDAASARQHHGTWTELGVSHATDNDTTAVSEPPRDPHRPPALLGGALAQPGRDGHDADWASRSLPPPLPRRPRSGPPPLPARQRATPPPLNGRRDDHEVRDVVKRSSEPPPLPNHTLSIADKDPEPEIAPPPYFAGQRAGQMALKLADDELWLFVHLEEVRASAFRRGVDLMLQLTEIESYPVLVLSLVAHGQEPHAIRLALDGHSDADLRVLEHLSRSFRARVVLYIGGVYCETLTASTLREGVAQAIADKLKLLSHDLPALSSAEALMRVLHAPPPLWNDDLPFGPARREASTTGSVLAAVEQLASWLRPDKLAEATLTYSVPRNVIEATMRRVLRAAVAFGVALPNELIKVAVEQRAASDEASLLRDQIQAFRQRVEHAQNDLGAPATRKNWEKLFAQAEARQVPIDESLRALAHAEATSSTRPDATRPLRPLEALPAQDLKARLQTDVDRLEAIRELCARGHPSAIDLVFAALDQLPPASAAVAMAHIMHFGVEAGDRLIETLTGPHEALRQTAALALGRLKLRRALLPLVKQLDAETTYIHPELARAFGDFGPAAVRTLVKAIPGASRAERCVAALAHLANHGAAKEVEKLENDSSAEVAQAARKAMAKRSRMEWEDLAVREQRTLEGSDPAALLSQAFYAELAKVAI